MTMTKEERIQGIIDNMESYEVIGAWNAVQDAYRYDDDHIYYMSELDDMYHGVSVSEFLSDLSDDFRVGDEYFKYGVWGLESFDDPYDVIDDDEIINYIINEDDDLGFIDIREVLDSEDEDEEEEEDEEA